MSLTEAFKNKKLGTLMLRKKKITVKVKIEYEEDVPDQEVEYVFDDIYVTHERGLTSYSFDHEHQFAPNGQERLIIKAWKGCVTFDSFERETEQ